MNSLMIPPQFLRSLISGVFLLLLTNIQALHADTLPEGLIRDFDEMELDGKRRSLTKASRISVAGKIKRLNEVLKPLRDQDSDRLEKDKHFILASSFTYFMYMMISVGESALENNLSELAFSEVRELVDLFIQYELVSDHDSFDKMMTTVEKIGIKKSNGDLKITMFTLLGKSKRVSFDGGIPSPRFVITDVIVENKATFIFSPLLAERNREELENFKHDSQKRFGIGGIVLMDEDKENIPAFLESDPELSPILVTGYGFGGKGYIRGFKLPSPKAKMETIYLIPGRAGTPAFIRSKTLFVKPFVAL